MSPKSEFQAHPRFTQLASLINSPDLEYALRTAMLTFIDNLETTDPAKSFHQFDGARRFIRTLKTLAVPPTEPKPNRIGQLNQIP